MMNKTNYPRPQMVRENWQNLNGDWDFAFDRDNAGEAKGFPQGFTREHVIRVPFTYETELSGIHKEEPCEAVWYQREIEIDGAALKNEVLIHFEGSDYITDLWVNGCHAGRHQGGYSRFSFPIASLLTPGKNTLVIKVWDSLSRNQPRGKQRWIPENFACWYVQTTGIWKTLWLEFLPKKRLESLKITPLLDEKSVEIAVNTLGAEENMEIAAKVFFRGEEVGGATVPVKDCGTTLRINVESNKTHFWGVKTWSPEEPNLYDLEVSLQCGGKALDKVESYFGMREVSIEGREVLLNGRPIYQRLLLDQGYWRKSHLTPPSEEAIIEDIDKIMALGYNGVRKHMKIEDERFLYWADVKGLLVWSEAPATFAFNDEALGNFTKEWVDIVRQNY
ncbi:MAG: glycoside hydrolase family 2, partial [Oscillospiraceae bacterium]